MKKILACFLAIFKPSVVSKLKKWSRKSIPDYFAKGSLAVFFFLFCIFDCGAEEEFAGISTCPYVESVNVITGEYTETHTDLMGKGPFPLTLTRSFVGENSFIPGNEVTWHFNHGEVITEGITPLVNSFSPETEVERSYDEAGRLKEVALTSASKSREYHRLLFEYEGERCHVTASDGQKLTYRYSLDRSHRVMPLLLIDQVVRPDGEVISYSYRNHPRERKKLISRREMPEGRFLETRYYDAKHNVVDGKVVTIDNPIHDFRIGRVKQQRAPVGAQGSIVTTHRFFYYPGYTEVVDMKQQKSVYEYDNHMRLTAVKTYKGDDLYRTLRLYWEECEGLLRLKAKALEDGNGVAVSCVTYEYDKRGNRTAETLWGNLTGESASSIAIDENGNVLSADVESVSCFYCYSEDDKLIEKREENGSCSRYCYDERGRLSATFILDHEDVRVRQFYFYDGDGLLVRTVSDDGSSMEFDDLTAVTERRESLCTLRASAPAVGMPERIRERYYDMKSGSYKTERECVNHYNQRGYVTRQEVFGPNGKRVAWVKKEYDEAGRCKEVTGSDGKEKRLTYDALGNLLSEEVTDEQGRMTITKNSYDLANRIISSEQIGADGTVKATTNIYNNMGEKVEVKDRCGNTTQYEYDLLGRPVHVVYPCVLDEKDCLVNPTVSCRYDLMDRLVEQTDLRGQTTKTEYNIRGKPTCISYSDGTQEEFRYSLDGTLISEKNRSLETTTYQYDFLGRKTKVEKRSSSGALAQATTFSYNAFHLIEERIEGGLIKSYRYDGAGRLVTLLTSDQNGVVKKVDYSYDDLGRPHSQKDWLGEKEYILTVKERDDNGRVKELCSYDGAGNLQKRMEQEENAPLSPYRQEQFECNEYGQYVLVEEYTNDRGVKEKIFYDALGRKERVEAYDPFGGLIKRCDYRYDIRSNLVQERHHRFSNREESDPYVIARAYDENNRLKEVTEGAFSEHPRTFRYSYDADQVTITKPDGTTVAMCYRDGQLKSLSSSDGSCNYSYSDDGKASTAVDNLTGKKTERLYDAMGNIIEERLANGNTLKSEYDKLGRRERITLPDHSSALYSYSGLNLSSIQRQSAEGALLYEHIYEEYDLSSRPTRERLIDGGSELVRSYDKKGRITSLTCDYWSEKLTYSASKLDHRLESGPGGEKSCNYAYDSQLQLVKEAATSYSYDSLNNRIEKDGVPYELNAVNQVVSDGTFTYAYDNNGNMIKKSGQAVTIHYSYDALNRLTMVTEEGSCRLLFTYDAFSRRMSKRVESFSGNGWNIQEEEHYLYDGNREIGALTSEGIFKSLRILGQGRGAEIGAAVAIEIEGALFLPIHDYKGSLRCLVDPKSCEVVESYSYDAFGVEELGGPGCQNVVKNPWRYFSKRVDSETGLVFFGERYYNPELGRWMTLDPLGDVDGPNRSLFVKNNPVTHCDFYGLFTVSDFITFSASLVKQLQHWVKEGYELFEQITMRSTLFKLAGIPTMPEVLEGIFGRGFLQQIGYYNFPSETGTYGQGEYHNKVRITLINGIGNVRSFFGESLEIINFTHGGNNIHYIYRPTEGWTWDIIYSVMIRFGYVSPYAVALAKTWKSLIEEMGGEGLIIHYCHSLGGLDTVAAGSLLTPEERAMVRVISFGSATMISGSLGFESVVNYVSVRDGVCLLDPIGYFQGFSEGSNVVFVGSFMGIPLVDHSLAGETYSQILTTLGYQFLHMYAFD